MSKAQQGTRQNTGWIYDYGWPFRTIAMLSVSVYFILYSMDFVDPCLYPVYPLISELVCNISDLSLLVCRYFCL